MSRVSIVEPADLIDVETLFVVGRAGRLLSDEVRRALPPLPDGAWDDMVKRGDPGDNGRTATTYTGKTAPRRVVACVLPEVCARHNAPSRAWSIPAQIKGAGASGSSGVLLAIEDIAHAEAQVLATARAFPTFTATSRVAERTVRVAVLAHEGPIDVAALQGAAEAVQRACDWIDRPPDRANPDALVEEASALGRSAGAEVTVLRGEDLRRQGLGGLAAVGQASRWEPALVVLDLPGDGPRDVWVGKGLTYDTGGLSLKGKADMPGMKTDMAGAAAVLHAFIEAAHRGHTGLTAVLCLAENAIGPMAMRPDDVIRLYSGRTVEVNNTDAEGRLVLADGIAWAVKNRAPRRIIDLATLTGAQPAATGKRVGAIYATEDALEQRLIRAGRDSGELLFPLPFIPEFYRGEFSSPIADMRNSVKDRGNAQSACAGQFLVEQLGSFSGSFAHLDIAGPAVAANGRGTGFGVGLLLNLLQP